MTKLLVFIFCLLAATGSAARAPEKSNVNPQFLEMYIEVGDTVSIFQIIQKNGTYQLEHRGTKSGVQSARFNESDITYLRAKISKFPMDRLPDCPRDRIVLKAESKIYRSCATGNNATAKELLALSRLLLATVN